MSTQPLSYSTRWLLLMSFAEGAAVMGLELASAKLITPFYGNGLQVWAAVLGITLFGLLTGYFYGGWLSERRPRIHVLQLLFAISGLLVLLTPYSSQMILTLSMSMPVKIGLVVSCLIFLYPPLVLFGMITPMIIRLMSEAHSAFGRNAGTVYAISTTGGIITTLSFGLYMLPYIGMTNSLLGISSVLLIFPLIYLLQLMLRKKVSV